MKRARLVKASRLFFPVTFLLFACFCLSAVNDKLVCKHIDESAFRHALKTARRYALTENVTAGVVPHHLTAAPLIGGFFNSLAEAGAEYDTVVIIGPNHEKGAGDVVVSFKDWDIFNGVKCNKEMVSRVLEMELKDGVIAEDDGRMEADHAVSNLVPFVNHYWPDAKIAPVLISGTLSFSDVIKFSNGINEIISEQDARVLLLCSIDFSHYLTPAEAKAKDTETEKIIKAAGLRAAYGFTDASADSPAALITFLNYAQANELDVNIADNTDASEFVPIDNKGTTSYFVMSLSPGGGR